MNRSIVILSALIILAVLIAVGSYAYMNRLLPTENTPPQRHIVHNGSISAEYAYAFATASETKTGAAFMILRNLSGAQDFLIEAKSDIAEHVELHENFLDENNVMSMRKVAKVEIPQGYDEVLLPNGKHIMLIGLRRQLQVGEKFDITLDFEKSEDITVTIEIVPPGQPLDPLNDDYPEGFEGGHDHDHGPATGESGEAQEYPHSSPPSIRAAE